jgi:hypothetical protein
MSTQAFGRKWVSWAAADIAAVHDSHDAAMRAAWASGGYSYREIGDYFGVHLSTVGWAVRQPG